MVRIIVWVFCFHKDSHKVLFANNKEFHRCGTLYSGGTQGVEQ